MNAYAVGPVPAAIERVKTVTILADAENLSLIFGPNCDEGGTSAELASPAADALLDSGSTAVLSRSDVGVNDSIGAEIEIAKPPIRRRRPRHGLGDLSSIDTNEVRKFRENVSQAPAQLVAENTKAADIARLRSYEERVRDYAKLAAQKRLKKERIALAEMASTLPSSDVVTILTRATSSGMPLAEVPLFEHLALSPDDVIENANEATRFWGGAVAIGQYNHDINTVIRRFQEGADHAEMAFYSTQDSSNYLHLLPSDFNSLADAILAERDVETRVSVRKAQSVNRVIAKIRKTRK